ncbi:50S ribosomal protein L23 [Patescibacteria group bacterium]|nr:50S ribosomal protein L23 [Patescibacteria group bacterium]MBU4580601.1 50S ribosomal protein L23 [Patescibacteria group bacterium]
MAGMIILEPLFTEKTSNLMPLNKYAFKVANQANKIEVKKAIEGLYNVNVISVNILKTSAKPKRVGRREMIKPGFKKAIVTLKEGESIEPTKK